MQLLTVRPMVMDLRVGADVFVLLVVAVLQLILEIRFRLFSLLASLISRKASLIPYASNANRRDTSTEIVPLYLHKCGKFSRKRLSDEELHVLADHVANPSPIYWRLRFLRTVSLCQAHGS